MKKFIILAALLTAFTFTLSAEETNDFTPVRHEENWSKLSYQVVPVLKVLEAREGYVVIYQKNKIGTGSTVIPKSWARGTPENPRKLKFRDTKNPAECYMTVVKKDGEFSRVILTIPLKKNNSMWGVVSSGTALDTDKDTLEELEL